MPLPLKVSCHLNSWICLVCLPFEAPGMPFQDSDVPLAQDSCPWLQLALPEAGQLGRWVGTPYVLSPCQPWELLMGTQMP